MFRNILLPTDGSPFADKVIEPAIELARAINAKVTGVFVYPHHRISPYGEFGPPDDLVEAQVREHAIEDGNTYLDRIEAAAKAAGVPCERALIEHNEPWKAVLATARKNGCDLILMSTHKRQGFAGMVLGSETTRVLEHTDIPVLVYH